MDIHFLSLILIPLFFRDVVCFYPNQFFPTATGTTFTHADITEQGIVQAVAAFFEGVASPGQTTTVTPGSLTGIANITARKLYDSYYGTNVTEKSFLAAISEITKYNNLVDQDHLKEAAWHFNAEKIQEGHTKMKTLRDDVISLLHASTPNYITARETIGQYLHLLQMFYSNTNWVEMKGSTIYSDLGGTGSLMTVAGPTEDTCFSCGPQFFHIPPIPCPLNLAGLNTATSVLTSSYRSGQDVAKPYKDPNSTDKGKCSHGGSYDWTGQNISAIGGISKDSPDYNESPHYTSHDSAAQAAILHTKHFFVDQTSGLLSVIGNAKFMNLLQLHSGQALVFVVDVTGSMSNIITAIVQTGNDLINQYRRTVMEPYSYILVTFDDDENSTSLKQTTDPDQMITFLGGISGQGGGDCPEFSLSGIKRAALEAPPESHLYIFTDASPKDREKQQFIEALIAEKNLHLHFFLFGTCIGTTASYRQRRSVSWKQEYTQYFPEPEIMQSSKNDQFQFKQFLELTSGESEAKIFVAEETGSLMIQVFSSDDHPAISLINPAGEELSTDLNLEDNYAGSVRKIKINNPQIGEWGIRNVFGEYLQIGVYTSPQPLRTERRTRPRQKRSLSSSVNWGGISIYTALSQQSGGHVYQTSSIGVLPAMDIFKSYTSSPGTTIMRYRMKGGLTGCDSINLPVDHSIKYFRVEVKGVGGTPDIYVKDPNGQTPMVDNVNVTRTTYGQNFLIFVVKNPMGGVWTIKRLDENEWELRVVVDSVIDFTYQFTETGADGHSLVEIQGRPIAGENYTMTFVINGIDEVHSADSVEFLDWDGNRIQHFTLQQKSQNTAHGYFTAYVNVPDEPFSVAIEGTDVKANNFRRMHTNLINTVAITIEKAGPLDKFYTNEDYRLPFVVSNVGGGNTIVNVTIEDDKKFALIPTSKIFNMAAGENITSHFVLRPGTTDGVSTLVSLSAEPVGLRGTGFQYDIFTLVTERRTVKRNDTIPPVCNITTVNNNCPLDTCMCGSTFVTVDMMIWDEGFGLQSITTSGIGDGAFAHTTFRINQTKEDGITYAELNMDCCRESALVTVQDSDGNTATCQINATLGYVPCKVNDTVTPTCTVKNTIGQCGNDVCTCGSSQVTSEIEISDEGFGLYQIVLDGSHGTMTHDPLQVSTTIKNYTVNAKLTTDCCRSSATLNITDLSQNFGACTIPVNPNYGTGVCIKQSNDSIPPHCGVVSVTNACSADLCKCGETFTTVDMEIWDEGFGLQTITATGLGNGAFVHSVFKANQTKADGVVSAQMKVDCCRSHAYVDVTDAAGNTNQCVVNVTANYQAPTTCNTQVNDTSPPACTVTQVTGQCDPDVCKCASSFVTADLDIRDEGFGIQDITSGHTGTLTHDPLSLHLKLSNITISAQLKIDCCRDTAYVNVTDLYKNEAQCIINVNNNFAQQTCTKTTVDTIKPHCGVVNTVDACDPDDCKCGETFHTSDLEIWDEGWGLATVTAQNIGNGAFAYTSFQPNHTKADGIVKAQIKVDCCRKEVQVQVDDTAGNTDICTITVKSNYSKCKVANDTSPPTCAVLSTSGSCPSDPCVCDRSFVTSDLQIQDQGFGLKKISSLDVSSTGFIHHDPISRLGSLTNVTISGQLKVDCCRQQATVDVVDYGTQRASCVVPVNVNYTSPCATTTTTTTLSNTTLSSTTTTASSSSSSSDNTDSSSTLAWVSIGLSTGVVTFMAIGIGVYILQRKYSTVIPQ